MAEAQLEMAATSGSEPGRRFASDEFFFLLQRIDRLDEKLTARIDAVDTKLMARMDAVDTKLTARMDALDAKFSSRIEGLEARLDGLRAWAIGLLFSMVVGFAGVIFAIRG